MTVRTRMAPSPTGEYHIGHIRTLLYNYAFTKKNKGSFVMRIEDTDRTRYVEGAIDRILNVICDYGFSWDEGPRVGGEFGPYIQSERLEIYKKHALDLVKSGHAYYCFCSEERLDQMRKDQEARGVSSCKYDRKCLDLTPNEVEKKLSSGEKYVIRLKVPQDRVVTFQDEVAGDISINTNDIDDQVLLKTDGFPTYHLGVVVDDHLMGITHVMRGNDWIPSTPKHVLLYEAFGWELPTYIHLPNLKEIGEGRKLSKRYGSVSAVEFLQEGYLVEALVNFLMFLGWNPGTEKEIYSMDEFISDFSLEKLQHEALVSFDRSKLLWFNGQYIRKLTDSQLREKIISWAKKFDVKLPEADNGFHVAVCGLIKDRLEKLSQFNELSLFFYEYTKPSEKDFLEFSRNPAEIISKYLSVLENITDWNEQTLDKLCHEKLIEFGYKPKEAFMTLRIALTAKKATPPLFAVMQVLGKNETLKRLRSSM